VEKSQRRKSSEGRFALTRLEKQDLGDADLQHQTLERKKRKREIEFWPAPLACEQERKTRNLPPSAESTEVQKLRPA
jgi:hypothetical protein